MRARGIDVSDNNGHVNWDEWVNEIDFAEVKATQGVTITDTEFMRNWKALKEMRKIRFAYHYGEPDESPSVQARMFNDIVHGGGLDPHDHFVLDFEDAGHRTPLQCSFWAVAFCHEMNHLNPGHRIIVQTFPSFAEAGHCAGLGAWPLWLMNWGVQAPVMPVGPWKRWALWQYATSVFDHDVYNGTLAALSAFVRSTGRV